MITCPHCYAELEAFEVSTAHGLTGSRLVVDCDECEKTFEVEVLVQEPPVVAPHAFEKEYQGESDAKRRLARCKHCGQDRNAAPHQTFPAA